jgi:hypothetical protein
LERNSRAARLSAVFRAVFAAPVCVPAACSRVQTFCRITAITDLTEELRKEAFTMDAAVEAKVVESILRLLEDSAKEVQDVAVKSLGVRSCCRGSCFGPCVLKGRLAATGAQGQGGACDCSDWEALGALGQR